MLEIRKLDEIKRIIEKYRELREPVELFYQYKELKKILGLPEVSFLDPEEAKRNLSGERLINLIESLEGRR